MQHSTESIGLRPFPMNYDFHRGEIEIDGQVAEAIREFGPEQLVFAGHFPKNKILPGVMLVEYALYLGESYLKTLASPYRLGELKSATFLAPVLPGHKVNCRCEFSPGGKAETPGIEMKATLLRGDTVCAKVRALFDRTT